MKGAVREEQIEELLKALQIVKNENNEGAILEFGVFEGYSLSEMMLFLNKNQMNNPVFGFDGFVGLPYSEWHWNKGEAASTKENTWNLIKQKVGNVENLTLVEGLYEETFKQNIQEKVDINQASFIHIDCDLSLSFKHVLNICSNVIKKGTIMAFHDWEYKILSYYWNIFVEKEKIMYRMLTDHDNQGIFYIESVGEE